MSSFWLPLIFHLLYVAVVHALICYVVRNGFLKYCITSLKYLLYMYSSTAIQNKLFIC